jgi:hypothetical protein
VPTLAERGFPNKKQNAEAQGLSRLKREAPELHQRVRDGSLGVKAGVGRLRRQKRAQTQEAVAAEAAARPGPEALVVRADCLDWFRAQAADSIDLVFGSPPYEGQRTYLENGVDLGIARTPAEWVRWMVEVAEAALRCCRGAVCFVVDAPTKNCRWSPSPFHLGAELDRRGIVLRKPHIYERQGIPGGGPDMPRNNYEFILLATRGGRLPWSDHTAMGHPPKSPRPRSEGRRAPGDGYATQEDIHNVGHHRARQAAGYPYKDPERVKASNVIHCKVGHGKMGDPLLSRERGTVPGVTGGVHGPHLLPPE